MVAGKFEDFEPERLVKSSQRVRDLGEVFTPGKIVDDMLDLLPSALWDVHPSKTFLEPSVGNGNFVSAILSRKLSVVDEAYRQKSLPAGTTHQAALFHALEALSSIYGVDISEENVIGGTPGHEVACRPRLLEILKRWHQKILGMPIGEDSNFVRSAEWILAHNMIVGNMLERDSSGAPTGRETLPIVEYEWRPQELLVRLGKTSLGDVLAEAEESTSDVLSVFGPTPAQELWSGAFEEIHLAPNNAQKSLSGTLASNARK